jgi:hypothetical protein
VAELEKWAFDGKKENCAGGVNADFHENKS